MTHLVFVEYSKTFTEGKYYWTYTIIRKGITAKGDLYPNSKKGLANCKRDASDILRHLRKTNEIRVKR